jgi:hypothetical protein
MLNYTVSLDEARREIKIDSIPQEIQQIFMPSDTDLLGLHLGMKIEEMTAILGEPLRTEEIYDGALGNLLLYYYRFGYIIFEPDIIPIGEYYLTTITIDNDQFFASRQIKVGMSYESILERYPVTLYEEEKWQAENFTQYLYQVSGSTYGVIDFDETKNVSGIRFFFDNRDFDINYSQFLHCYLCFDIYDNRINSIDVGWAENRD